MDLIVFQWVTPAMQGRFVLYICYWRKQTMVTENSADKLKITFFYREPRATGLSIEGIFALVSSYLRDTADVTEFYCDAHSSRLKNILRAGKFASNVNHITGDVNFLALGLRGRKNVLTIHDFGFYENPVHSKLVKAVYKLFWFSLPLRYIKIVTVVSEFTRQRLLHHFHFPQDRIRVIYDPVKPLFLYSEKKQLSDHPVVLMMGTGKHKNLDGLISAVKGTGFHIDIVGWPAQDEIARMEDYGISYKVYNKLTDEEVYERYKGCDVLFNASFYEGFGMPIIEAQAVGRPVITSNIGAMKEIGQGSALLVDPNNANDIRNALESLKDAALYGDLIRRGLRNAEKFDYRKIAEQYLAVYEEVSRMKGR